MDIWQRVTAQCCCYSLVQNLRQISLQCHMIEDLTLLIVVGLGVGMLAWVIISLQ